MNVNDIQIKSSVSVSTVNCRKHFIQISNVVPAIQLNNQIFLPCTYTFSLLSITFMFSSQYLASRADSSGSVVLIAFPREETMSE